jgi:hypothetical protein
MLAAGHDMFIELKRPITAVARIPLIVPATICDQRLFTTILLS